MSEEVLLKIVLGVVGWIAIRHELIGLKVMKLETRLENGIADAVARLEKSLSELRRDVKQHVDGEEGRIMAAIQRNPRSRTRRDDRQRGDRDDA